MSVAKLAPKQARGRSLETAQTRYKPYEEKLKAVCLQTRFRLPLCNRNLAAEAKKGRFAIKDLSARANMGEVFRLEYSLGLPLDNVAFAHGRNAAQVSNLMV